MGDNHPREGGSTLIAKNVLQSKTYRVGVVDRQARHRCRHAIALLNPTDPVTPWLLAKRTSTWPAAMSLVWDSE